jgi:eukaryotic-like serine/threonine-protein kinase
VLSTALNGKGAAKTVVQNDTSLPPRLGAWLYKRYRILRQLGQGGMSNVFLAFDSKNARNVAIKLLRTDIPRSKATLDRFIREAKLALEISHPNIVKGIAAHRDKTIDRELLVLEYIDGGSLQDRLDRDGRIPVDEATRYIIQIAHALDYLHSKDIIHRDVKPGNILVSSDGVAKLADLGVAKKGVKTGDLTSAEDELGTPYYMPWEQMMNSGLVDPRSDLFALGATFYHLVTGQVPYSGDSYEAILNLKSTGKYVPARQLDPSLPPEIDCALERLLAKNPKERFSNAVQVVEVLGMSGLKLCQNTVEPDSGIAMHADDVATKVQKAVADPIESTPLDSMGQTQSNQPASPGMDWLPPAQRVNFQFVRRSSPDDRTPSLSLSPWIIGGLALLIVGWLLF